MIMLPKWLKINMIFFLGFLSFSMIAQNDEVDLEVLLESAVKTHPLNGQRSLIESKSGLNIKAFEKRNMPNIDFNAQASIQSENIDLEFPIPNLDPISLPLYRVQTNLESNYMLFDGGLIKSLIKNEEIKAKIADQNLNVLLFKIKEKVVDIYFSILLLQKQKEILDSSLFLLDTQEKIVNSAIDNGVALKSDLDKLNIEKIKVNQSKANIANKIITLKVVLSHIAGIDLKQEKIPDIDLPDNYIFDATNRPEYKLFGLKTELLSQSKTLITSRKKPKVVLFAKAGIGYPNPFNFFDDNIAPYAIGGVKLVWNIWDWKKSSIEQQKLNAERSFIDNQKLVLDDEIKKQFNKLHSEIEGIQSNLHFDDEIIARQKKIIKTTLFQYMNGTAKISDYIKELNVNKIEKIKKEIHKLEIVKLNYKIKILLNK